MSKTVDETFEIVWLDQNRSENVFEPDHLSRQVDLDQYFNCLRSFNAIDSCLTYILTLDTDEKVILIVSGFYGETILTSVHDQTQIVSVFIFCEDFVKHREWAEKYSKIRGVFTEANSLVRAIDHDAQLLLHHFIPTNIFTVQDIRQTSFQNIDKDQANFVWFQLLIDVLSKLPQTARSRQDLIEECRRCYAKNESQLEKIVEFENSYTPDQAIRWYTRDCFLFRLINRALRTRNIEHVFKFRNFFCDLQHQLFKLYQQQRNEISFQTVYRGQIISADEINKLKQNKGGIYSINTFLSATVSSDVALSFNSDAYVRPQFERVLFEIQLNLEVEQSKTPFADIQNLSYNHAEQEVLFSMGSVFRIDDVDQWTNDLWLVQLTLIEESRTEQSLRKYFLTNTISERATLLELSSFLSYMGDYHRAKQFCELLLKEDSMTDTVRMQAHSDLAFYHYRLGDLDSAESYARLSLQLQSDFGLFAPATYSVLGLIASARQQFRRAVQYHQFAVDQIRSREAEENESVTSLYTNLGMAWMDLHQAIPALYWCEQIALPCQLRILPSDHPALLTNLANIAEIYEAIGDYTKSYDYYKRSLKIQKTILPSIHMDIAETFQGLALVSLKLGNYKRSLRYYRRAQNIILSLESYRPADLVASYLGLAAVYEELQKVNKALGYYRRALRSLSIKNREDYKQLASTWNNIGFLYLQNLGYNQAIKYFLKALHLERKFLPVRASLVLTTLSNIGMVYQATGCLKRALFYHQFVLRQRKTYLRSRDPDMAITWDNLGVVFCKMGRYRKALEYHHRALTIYTLTLPIDHPATICVCEHIGDVYYLLGKKQKARRHHHQPERMAHVHLRKIEKYGLRTTLSDGDIVIEKLSKLALLIDSNAFAYSTSDHVSK